MATGAPDSNGIWIYGEDDSEATFSALLNKLGNSASSALTSKLSGLPGKIVNIQSGFASTELSSTSTTFIDTGLSVSITPQKAANRLLIFGQQSFRKSGETAGNPQYDARLLVNGGFIYTMNRFGLYGESSFGREVLPIAFTQAAGTTSTLTFKTQFNRSSGTGIVYANTDSAIIGRIIVVEVSQ
jgi:hypothetical protein